jgi:hypothetical protein
LLHAQSEILAQKSCAVAAIGNPADTEALFACRHHPESFQGYNFKRSSDRAATLRGVD